MTATAPQLFCWKPGDGENFGDSLGPAIVRGMLECAQRRNRGRLDRNGNEAFTVTHDPRCSPKILAIGSVAQFARTGDTIWGAGLRVEGQTLPGAAAMNILALRGVLSAEALSRDVSALPLGDPAMLLPVVARILEWPVEYRSRRPPGTDRVSIVPNLRHVAGISGWPGYPWRDYSVRIVSPYLPWHQVLRHILSSDHVIATSLHAVILAESFGVSVEWISSPPLDEGTFKLRDYLSSTGRTIDNIAQSEGVAEALKSRRWRGGSGSRLRRQGIQWDAKPLWHAFPWEVFGFDAPDLQ